MNQTQSLGVLRGFAGPILTQSKRLTLLLALVVAGCATPKTSREVMDERNSQSRASPATYSSEGFYMDYRNPPDRNTRNWDFFYKHCKLVGRNNPAPTRSEWDCSDPY